MWDNISLSCLDMFSSANSMYLTPGLYIANVLSLLLAYKLVSIIIDL